MTLLTDSLVTDLGFGLPLAEKVEKACIKFHKENRDYDEDTWRIFQLFFSECISIFEYYEIIEAFPGLIDDSKRIEDHISEKGEASLAYVFDKMNIE